MTYTLGNCGRTTLCIRVGGRVPDVLHAHVLGIEQDERGRRGHEDADQPEEGSIKDVRHLTPLRRLIQMIMIMIMMAGISSVHRFGVDAGTPRQPTVRLYFVSAAAIFRCRHNSVSGRLRGRRGRWRMRHRRVMTVGLGGETEKFETVDGCVSERLSMSGVVVFPSLPDLLLLPAGRTVGGVDANEARQMEQDETAQVPWNGRLRTSVMEIQDDDRHAD